MKDREIEGQRETKRQREKWEKIKGEKKGKKAGQTCFRSHRWTNKAKVFVRKHFSCKKNLVKHCHGPLKDKEQKCLSCVSVVVIKSLWMLRNDELYLSHFWTKYLVADVKLFIHESNQLTLNRLSHNTEVLLVVC